MAEEGEASQQASRGLPLPSPQTPAPDHNHIPHSWPPCGRAMPWDLVGVEGGGSLSRNGTVSHQPAQEVAASCPALQLTTEPRFGPQSKPFPHDLSVDRVPSAS